MAKKPGRNYKAPPQKHVEAWWRAVRARLTRLLVDAKYRAKRDGVEFSVTFEDLKIPENCPALGIPLRWDANAPRETRPSIDRFDNSKGYTPENTRVISLRANRLKQDATKDEIAGLHKYMGDGDD